MVRKKAEGDEDQRRAAAHAAEKEGERPSERHATTGASKQPSHGGQGRGQGQAQREGKQPRQDAARRTPRPQEPMPSGREFTGRGRPEYGEEHARVFNALGEAERRRGGEAVPVREVAGVAGLPEERTRELLHDLVTVHRLATEIQDGDGADEPDVPRYELKPRR